MGDAMPDALEGASSPEEYRNNSAAASSRRRARRGRKKGSRGRRAISSRDSMDSSAAESARFESANIISKRYVQRGQVKSKLLSTRSSQNRRVRDTKREKQLEWQQKMERSPFLVDLLAENERIEEENRVRLREEARRTRSLDKRKTKVKNVIILKALQEASDLDALRAEKRMIMMEERRLKALLDLEKTNSKKKADLLSAKRAEKQRKQMQLDYRRQQRIAFETEIRIKQREALKEKLGVKDRPLDACTF